MNKNVILFIVAGILLIFHQNNYPQEFWENYGNSIPARANDFLISVNGSSFLAAGYFDEEEAGIYKSTDNGVTWIHKAAEGFATYTLLEYGNRIWAGSYQGLHYSTDNGETWVTDSVQQNAFGYFNSLAVNSNGILFAGFSGGILFRSSDGGMNWEVIFDDTYDISRLYSIAVNSDDQIFVAADKKLFRSDDDGISWLDLTSNISSNQISSIRNVTTVGRNEVFIATNGAGILKSPDDGASWISINYGLFGSDYNSLATKDGSLIFLGADNLYGSNSGLYYTINGGVFWKSLEDGLDNMNISCFYLNNGYIFIGANSFDGSSSIVYKSKSMFDYWEVQFQSLGDSFNKIYFTNIFEGYSCTEDGKIFLTKNSGQHWEERLIAQSALNSIYFINSIIGFVAGDSSVLFKTIDNGLTWAALSIGTVEDLTEIYFINETTGFITGSAGTLLKTSDGGSSWSEVLTDEIRDLNSVYFSSDNEGWAAGSAGLVLHSTDWGNTWVELAPGIFDNIDFMKIWFENSFSGWLISEQSMYKTTDGGVSWHQITITDGYTLVASAFGSFERVSNVLKYKFGTEEIFQINFSTDAGENWEIQLIPTEVNLKSIFMIDDSTQWVCGANGNILTNIKNYQDPLQINTVNSITDNQFQLTQNFPNPFNSTTIINYFVPVQGRTTLKLYDILGNELATIIDENQEIGWYHKVLDGSEYASGVYIYLLHSGGNSLAKKMVLLR